MINQVSFSPAKRNLAGIRLIAHTRMQFEKLPHAFAVNAATWDPGLTFGEMTN